MLVIVGHFHEADWNCYLCRWLVMGGSWGVTLALAYAQSHPDSVAGLILRGVCLLRPQEIDWFYKQVFRRRRK